MKHINEEERATITKFDLLFESRVTRLESTNLSIERSLSEIKDSIKELKTETKEIRNEGKADFRLLLGFMLGGFAGLFGIMAHGFHWL